MIAIKVQYEFSRIDYWSEKIITDKSEPMSVMTDKNSDDAKDMKDELERVLKILHDWLEVWEGTNNRVLTTDQISFLGILARKSVLRESLTKAERQMKTEVHKKVRNSLADIEFLIDAGFIGSTSLWNPAEYGLGESKLPYDIDYWREDIPIDRVCRIVECLVNMFGDEYAVPLLSALQKGIASRPENSNFSIEIPITKRMKS